MRYRCRPNGKRSGRARCPRGGRVCSCLCLCLTRYRTLVCGLSVLSGFPLRCSHTCSLSVSHSASCAVPRSALAVLRTRTSLHSRPHSPHSYTRPLTRTHVTPQTRHGRSRHRAAAGTARFTTFALLGALSGGSPGLTEHRGAELSSETSCLNLCAVTLEPLGSLLSSCRWRLALMTSAAARGPCRRSRRAR